MAKNAQMSCSCGARLSAAFRYGHFCYQCPRGDDAKPCIEHRVRAIHLLSWARTLFEQLEALTRADFAAAVAALAREQRHTSPGALQSIERSLEREQQLFLWGHCTVEHYQAERERLEALRDELKAAAPAPAIELRGLLDTWDNGDHVARRELLAAMFDCLHVSGGQIFGYTARADRHSEVLQIMEALRRRVINVGGDGSPTRLTDPLRLMP
jgi:hypothetical protein